MARQLAGELEVSVRTVYGDVEALGAAGIPLCGAAGHAGGYRLVEGYGTRLTGLTADEAQAAFLAALLAPPPSSASARRSPPPGSSRAPPFRRSRASTPSGSRSASCSTPPAGTAMPSVRLTSPHLTSPRRGRRRGVGAAAVVLRYRRWRAPEKIERRVEPYGLVLKPGRWYPVANGPPGIRIRSYRIDQFLELRSLVEEFVIQEGLDLTRHWNSYLADFRARLHTGEALLRLTPESARRLGVPSAGDAWAEARVLIESIDHAHGEFLRLGAGVEVVAPAELRDRIAETVRTLAVRYEG